MIIANIPTKGVNPGAFSRELSCPYCRGTKWRFVTKVTPFRLRYLCKSCKKTVIYDISNRPDHPYAEEMKSNRFMDFVRKIKQRI